MRKGREIVTIMCVPVCFCGYLTMCVYVCTKQYHNNMMGPHREHVWGVCSHECCSYLVMSVI